MTKLEFVDTLRRSLSGRFSYNIVNENVAYYENYIDAEIRKGRSEEAVLAELGDPRLLAKTIVSTNQERTDADEEVLAEKDKRKKNFFKRAPLWLIIVVIIIAAFIILFLLQVLGAVILLLLPILIPIVAIWYLIRLWRKQ